MNSRCSFGRAIDESRENLLSFWRPPIRKNFGGYSMSRRRIVTLAAVGAGLLTVSAAPAWAAFSTVATACNPSIGAPGGYVCAKTQFDNGGLSARALNQIFPSGSQQWCIVEVRLQELNSGRITGVTPSPRICDSVNQQTLGVSDFARAGECVNWRSAAFYTYGGRSTVDVAYTGNARADRCAPGTPVAATTSASLEGSAGRTSVSKEQQDAATANCFRGAGFAVEELEGGGGHTSYAAGEKTKFDKAWKKCA